MAMDLPTIISPVPKQVRWAKSNTFSTDNLAIISRHLKFLSDRLSGLPVPPPPPSDLDSVAPKLISSLSHDEVVQLVHRHGSILPPICLCDLSNSSDTKTHWTSEELHPALGCHHFRNYKHIIQTSLDGQWIDRGEFPLLLGTFMTIPKAPRGGAIDHKQSFFLDIIHVDIAFDDCVFGGRLQVLPHFCRPSHSLQLSVRPQGSFQCLDSCGFPSLPGGCWFLCLVFPV